MTGTAKRGMLTAVARAREWVLSSKAGILAACEPLPEVREACADTGISHHDTGTRIGLIGRVVAQGAMAWDWVKEDLLVHFTGGGCEGMAELNYTAVVALAMVSYFTGR
jgi:hypothetical protein